MCVKHLHKQWVVNVNMKLQKASQETLIKQFGKHTKRVTQNSGKLENNNIVAP